jgi:uncharacterized protein YbjQ (UPF0145 family)
MILTTSDDIPGKRRVRTLGLVKGNTIRATHLGHDIMASLRNLIGGEVTDYTKVMAEAREQAIDRMVADAEKLGADAVVTIRFATTEMMRGCAELLCYGTAVTIEDE